MMNEEALVSGESNGLPFRLALALDGLTQAAVKLRALAAPGDIEDAASVIGAMLQTLRADVEKLRALDDRCERMVLAEQMAAFAEDLVTAAGLLRDSAAGCEDVTPPSARAAVDVAVQGMRFALALRSMGSPMMSLAVH